MVDQSKISTFHSTLFDWWDENKRDLPWRNTKDPYKILVSEFMLQQTQVVRVIPKYHNFIEKYPSLQELADAEKSDVIAIWQGLGYNRRAIWLHDAAARLVEYKSFPKDPAELQKIKGIGPYTSRAVVIFAFNRDIATVDTNIRRILLYKGFIDNTMSRSEIQKVAEQLVPKGRSRDYHNALMDYGALKLTATETGIGSKSSSPSKFRNSNRQYRGKIVTLLVDNGAQNIHDLATTLDISKRRLDRILEKLLKDELIEKEHDKIRLPS